MKPAPGNQVLVLNSLALDPDRADEQDTLIQTGEISAALVRLGFEVQTYSFGFDFASAEASLRDIQPDFVFYLVESVKGSVRLQYVAAAMLDLMGIPYTGCSAGSMAILSDKVSSKMMMAEAGLPTPDCFTENSFDIRRGGRYIVKSTSEHASVGIDSASVVSSTMEARKLIAEKRLEYGGEWFAERYIEGREFNVAVIADGAGGYEVLPPAEIIFKDFPAHMPKIVDFAAKWDENSFAYHSTVRNFDFPESDRILISKLKTLTLKCRNLFALKGAARVDFRVDERGRPWIIEINTNPCLQADAGLVAAACRAGFDQTEVVNRLVNDLNGETGCLQEWILSGRKRQMLQIANA